MLRFGFLLAALVILFDQASKIYVLALFDPPRPIIEVTSFLNIVLVWNRGISFGLFGSGADYMPWVLSGLALVIAVVLVVWLARVRTRLPAIGIALVLGGAVGNVIDRIRFGAVVDFVDFHLSGWHWPAFNVADSAITVGVVLLLYDSLFGGRESGK